MSAIAKVRAVLLKTTYEPITWKRLPVERVEIEADDEDALMALYFREYSNRYKYCNSINFAFEDRALQARFVEWIKDVRNYMNNGGDMW